MQRYDSVFKARFIADSASGSYVCERVDERLVNVKRRDLDPASRDAVFAAQRQTRREEGTTAERKAAECVFITARYS